MAQKFVGIDLGSHTVKFVVASVSFRGVQIHETFDVEVTPQESHDTESVLSAAAAQAVGELRQRRLAHLPVCLALPGGAASYRALQFPFSDQKRITQALSFELDGQFPYPVSELEYDHLTSPARTGGQALVVAVRRDFLDAIAGSYREAGIDVRLITTAPIGLAQACGGEVRPLSPEAAEEGLKPAALIIDMGARTTEIVALVEKGPVAVRSLRRGGRNVTVALSRAYGFDLAQAEQAKRQQAFLPHAGLGELDQTQAQSARVTARALEHVIRELEHTRLWLRSELQLEVSEVRLAGGGAQLKGLSEYLGEQLGLPVTLVRPTVGLSPGPDPAGGWSSSAAALGAVLGAAKRPLIQLNDAVAADRDTGWLQEQFGAVVLIGVAIMALASIDTVVKVKSMESERALYEEELATATYKVFGEELLSSDEVADALKGVRGSEDVTKHLPQRGALEVLEMFARAAHPSDAEEAAKKAEEAATGASPGGEPGTADNPDGAKPGEDSSADPAEEPDPLAALEPVDPSKGIVTSDDLFMNSIDVRERKIEMKVTANRAGAQDRLALKLEQLGCIKNITKGRIVDRNDKKVFEMTMDNACYRDNSDEEGEG